MTSFENRGKAFENKFAHDQELGFRIISRRRKLLGLWAAEKMHKNDEESLSYALEIVRFGIDDNREGAVVKRVLSDLNTAGINVKEAEIREKMEELHEIAEEQIKKEIAI